jgi:hypothetical protein
MTVGGSSIGEPLVNTLRLIILEVTDNLEINRGEFLDLRTLPR